MGLFSRAKEMLSRKERSDRKGIFLAKNEVLGCQILFGWFKCFNKVGSLESLYWRRSPDPATNRYFFLRSVSYKDAA